MPPDPNDEIASPADGGKECPVCDQEYNGTCPLRSSDCPFAYEETPDDTDLAQDDSLLPDLGLDDDFEDTDEDDDLVLQDEDDREHG